MTEQATHEARRVAFDRTTGRYCVRYDPSSVRDLSTVLVQALADVKGVDPIEIPRLNDVVDPDAMNAIFRAKPDGTPREGGRLAFTLSGAEVVVHGDGRIQITPAEGG